MKMVLFLFCAMGLVPPISDGRASSESPAGDPLPPCPDKPNCVSSLDTRPVYAVAPLSFQGNWLAARERMVSLLAAMPRTKVKSVADRYVRAECRSRIFRFVDDLTFCFVPDQGIIHVRSASRLGYSDFGVNRERVETIRQLWEQGAGQSAAKKDK